MRASAIVHSLVYAERNDMAELKVRDFTRSNPARNLLQTTCGYCGSTYVSSDDLIPKLEVLHRQTCERPVHATD